MPQHDASKELPSHRFFERLDDAITNWRKARGQRSGAGMKATELHGLMRKAFPDDAPPHASGVAHWLKQDPSTPGLDAVYMLAKTLGVRPSWLAFGEEPMSDASIRFDDRPYERPPGDAGDAKKKRTG